MKQFARLNHNEFIINGEVNERLPLYNEHLYDVYPLDGCIDGVMPDYTIESGNIITGASSTTILRTNVSVLDRIMKFTGENNSYIALDKDLMNAEEFVFKFKFKITDMSSDSTVFSSDDLTIKVDAINKCIYGEMPNLVGKYTPKPDLNDNSFRFTPNNSVIENTWHELKIVKYKSIVSIVFEHNTTKSMVCENDFAPSTSYLGKGLKGQIAYMNIWKHKKFSNEKTIELPSSYSLSGLIKATSNGVYDILNIGDLRVKINNNYLVISNGSTTVLNQLISLNRDYGFACGFENNQLILIVRDMKTDDILLNNTISLTYSNTAIVNANGIIRNLAIYKIRLSDVKLIAINKKKFSLNKDGNILYEVDETSGHNRLKFTAGRKYHLQLTRDLNSDCGTITNNSKVDFVDGGVESRLESRKIKLLFADNISLSSTWDIIYKTKITELTNGNHYDSFGNGLAWGIENNKFVIKYIKGQTIISSYIDNINANELLNEWLLFSVSYYSNVITFSICTSKGTFSTNMVYDVPLTTSEYDIFFGGIEDTIYGQAIYRELTIINGWNVDIAYKEKFFKTRLSYCDNKLISNTKIVELT